MTTDDVTVPAEVTSRDGAIPVAGKALQPPFPLMNIRHFFSSVIFLNSFVIIIFLKTLKANHYNAKKETLQAHGRHSSKHRTPDRQTQDMYKIYNNINFKNSPNAYQGRFSPLHTRAWEATSHPRIYDDRQFLPEKKEKK